MEIGFDLFSLLKVFINETLMRNDMVFHYLTQVLLMLQPKWQIIICKNNGCLDLQPTNIPLKIAKKNRCLD
jgi:hypothetical protein